MTDDVQAYVEGISAEHRPRFDRLHGLILAVRPEAAVRHGISLYGWSDGADDGFAERHPELLSGTGTIRLRPEDAAALPDEELTGLVQAALGR